MDVDEDGNETNKTIPQAETPHDSNGHFEPRRKRDLSAGEFYEGLRQSLLL